MTRALLIALVLIACGKEDKANEQAPTAKPSTAGAKDRGNYRDVRGLDPLEVEVPPDAQPDDVVPGFRNADGSFAFVMRPLGPTLEQPDPASLRSSMKYGVKDWVKEEKLDDGWYVTHTMDKKDLVMVGDVATTKVVGVEYSMLMRRKIGDTWYSCTCILAREELLAPVIKACKSLRRKA